MMEDQIELPPGFRFHPTDEELITHYLLHKVVDHTFDSKAIGLVDMNKIEPWELPREAKTGEKELYFFCLRDKKYPTGLRTNRATAAGYWKATGKDKQIFRGRSLVGMKKTLVFYIGRAPKGEKTNWVIHEYRLEGEFSHNKLPKSAKIEWVICRVFHKNIGEKKLQISGLIMADSGGGDGGGGGDTLPPLMNSVANNSGMFINSSVFESNHVHCFSNSIENQTEQKGMITNLLNNPISPFESSPDSLLEGQSNPITRQFPSRSPFAVSDSAILRGLIGAIGSGLKETEVVAGSQETGVSSEKNTEVSCEFEEGDRGIEIEDHEAPSVDLDCLWNY